MFKWVSQRNLAILAFMGASAAVAAGFLGALWTPFDILSHMRTHFVGGALVALIAIIWSRFGLVLLGTGAAVVLLAHSAIAWTQQDGHPLANLLKVNSAIASTPSITKTSKALTVLSYNTWHSNRQLGALDRQIATANADIVILTEFGPNKRPMLDKWRQQYPYQAQCSTYWFCSLAILSKHPIKNERVIRRTGDRAPMVVAELDIDGRPLTVVGTHLLRPIDGPRRQRREIHSLSRVLHRIEGDVLLGGDFNATRWSTALQTLVRNASLTSGSGFLPSWPRVLPQLAIDHVFTRGKVKIVSMKLAPNGSADHIAILGKVELR